MRYRLGRIVRLIIGLALLVLLIPFLMSKLDSGTSRSTADGNGVDYPDVRKKCIFFSLLIVFFLNI
jgi:hypothetical protein